MSVDVLGDGLIDAYRREADRWRLRTEVAEARVAGLELHHNEVSEDNFAWLWETYGVAPDEKLSEDACALKRRLREIVGIDAAEAKVKALRIAVGEYLAAESAHQDWPCLVRLERSELALRAALEAAKEEANRG